MRKRHNRRKIPPLPYEVFGIIADFLAGSHAFGTLANLNLVNHLMRMETLPALYETVLLDNIENLEYYRDWTFTLPLGFKYTKFHFCAETDAEFCKVVNTKQRAIMFPQLIMTVSVDRDTNVESANYNPDLDDTNCSIWLERSVTAATAFGVILNTPVHHNRRSHEQCIPASSAQCDAERRKRPVRPLQTFTRICRRAGASILPDAHADTDWTTCVRPQDLQLIFQPSKTAIDQETDSGKCTTLVELLKLASRHRKTLRLKFKQDGQGERAVASGSLCRHHPEHIRWHLRFYMPWTVFELFVEEYYKLVEMHPQILRNRISFMFEEQVPPQTLSNMTKTLAAFYNKFTDRINFLACWKPAAQPLVLFRLACRYSMLFGRNGLVLDPRLFGLGGSLLVDGSRVQSVVYSRVVPFMWQLS